MYAYKFIIALTLLGIASSELLSAGSCPENIVVEPNFNVEQYMGLWYEYARYPTRFQTGAKCGTAEYAVRADGNVSVINKQLDMSTNLPDGIEGYGVPVGNAKLNVFFPVTPYFNATSNYWVTGTDYSTYSVVYSCHNNDNSTHGTTVWILTRERVPSDDVVAKAKNVMVQHGFYLEPLVQTYQNGCF